MFASVGSLAIVIIFSVRARVDLQFKDELSLKVSFLGIKLFALPKKPKKYKIGNYTLKKIAKRDAEKAAKEKAKEAKSAAEDAKADVDADAVEEEVAEPSEAENFSVQSDE